jgi:hypothetical protein
MDVVDLMRQCNTKVAPSKALVKGLARELDLSESMLDKLAEAVRNDRRPSERAAKKGKSRGLEPSPNLCCSYGSCGAG